ncbi:DUF3267 domain-containing protein [Solibacillus sp. CAU 1738]|uniref:DUF3267 domain-containing protein n=1 Tax=Solibacillus sp. CAU 1738 TaxID=3140363 RepID=UPI0032613AFE
MIQNEPHIIELNMQKIAKANIWLTIILMIIFFILNSLIHQHFTIRFSFLDTIIFSLAYIVLIALHEAFHLIGFMIFGNVKYKELDYGVNLKLGIAYATTSKPLRNKAMKRALLLPFWTTGVIPSMIGFYIDSTMLVLLGAVLIAGAVGDFYMYKELKKFTDDALVKDDPKLPKLYVYQT